MVNTTGRWRETSRPTACIATLDPQHQGGVLTVTRILYQLLARNGWEPYLVYNSIDPDMQFPSRQRKARQIRLRPRPETYDGMRGYAVPLPLPQLESVSYVLNYPLWRSVCRGADVYAVVGGGNQQGTFFALDGLRYFCWVGTTHRSERSTRPRPAGWKYLLQRASDSLLYPLERYTYRRAQLVLAHSPMTQRDIIGLGIPPDRVEFLPVPIDTSVYRPLPTVNHDSGDYVVLVGRLSDPRKNVELLLRALASARSTGTDIPAVLVGQTDQRLQLLCRQLGLSDLVQFTGYVTEEQKLRYLQNACFFVLPSRQEGFGIVAFEAMACGLPVIATRCGALEDLIEPGVTGLLVNNDDEGQLCAAMLELWHNPAQCRRMGERARACVEHHFGLPRVECRLLEVISRPSEVGVA